MKKAIKYQKLMRKCVFCRVRDCSEYPAAQRGVAAKSPTRRGTPYNPPPKKVLFTALPIDWPIAPPPHIPKPILRFGGFYFVHHFIFRINVFGINSVQQSAGSCTSGYLRTISIFLQAYLHKYLVELGKFG